jgi:hypothetical protein
LLIAAVQQAEMLVAYYQDNENLRVQQDFRAFHVEIYRSVEKSFVYPGNSVSVNKWRKGAIVLRLFNDLRELLNVFAETYLLHESNYFSIGLLDLDYGQRGATTVFFDPLRKIIVSKSNVMVYSEFSLHTGEPSFDLTA